MKVRYALFLVTAAAVFAFAAAWAAVKGMKTGAEGHIPTEVYADFEVNRSEASFFLRSEEGYVEVFSSDEDRKPISITDIETGGLRSVDKAMLEKGIPVLDKEQLLTLLEDLGS